YSDSNGHLSWSVSTDDVLGYNIYKRNDTTDVFTKINTELITGNSFIDSCLVYEGVQRYMLKALKLETTPSGTFYNLSTGICDTLYNPQEVIVSADFTFENTGSEFVFTNTSQNASNYHWDFGDGSTSTEMHPTHI